MPRSRRAHHAPPPDPAEALAMYLPGEDLTTFTTRVIGKPHAETPAELARLQYHIREAGNARTAQQDAQRAATEQALTPEQVQQQGCDWLGL